MRVLAINDEPLSGGAAQLFRRTNEVLRGAGHEVVEVTGQSLVSARALRPLRPSRVRQALGRAWLARPLHRLHSEAVAARRNIRHVHYPGLIAHLRSLLAKTHFDVAHIHNVHFSLSTQVFPFLKSQGVPIVYQVNDYYFFCNTHWAYNKRLDETCKRCIHGNAFWAFRYGCAGYFGERHALVEAVRRLALNIRDPWSKIDLYVVTSDKAGELLEEWGVRRDRQFRAWNAMRLEEFEVPLSLGDEIIFYGTCLPNKGIATFLDALEDVTPGSRIGVYLLGMDSGYESRLRQVAARRGLQLTCDSHLRWDNGLREVVASARAVVVPSQWWVTSENVVCEAMLLGKATIVGRAGGNAELVEHEQTGFLFEPRNHEQLARYMNLLAMDRALAERMGKAARERARERFAEARFLSNLEAAYQRAISAATKRA